MHVSDCLGISQGEPLGKILDELELTDIHLVGPDVGMAAALSYALTPKNRIAGPVVGHSVGAPGPLKLAMLINLMSRFGVLRWNTAVLEAGPLIAFTSTFGAIRHRYNPTQVDDFISSASYVRSFPLRSSIRCPPTSVTRATKMPMPTRT